MGKVLLGPDLSSGEPGGIYILQCPDLTQQEVAIFSNHRVKTAKSHMIHPFHRLVDQNAKFRLRRAGNVVLFLPLFSIYQPDIKTAEVHQGGDPTIP